MTAMLDLSIVIPTCNRATHLEKLLVSLWTGVGCSYEVIVVDGASDDGTESVLLDAKRAMRDALRIIREERREGFVRAAALEAPRGIRVNVVSPPWVTETLRAMKMEGVPGLPAATVARAYALAVNGATTGQVIEPA